MPDLFSQLHGLLADVIFPNLQSIQASQAEQRIQTEELDRNLQEFRSEMLLRFAELRAEIALCRQEVEDAMVTLRDAESSACDSIENAPPRKTRIH